MMKCPHCSCEIEDDAVALCPECRLPIPRTPDAEADFPNEGGILIDEPVAESNPQPEPDSTELLPPLPGNDIHDSGRKAAAICVRCGCPSPIKVCAECATLPAPSLTLLVEGWDPVLYRGRRVMRIAITTDEVTIGRRDPASGVWPDIDLREIHLKEGDLSYISRKHAKIVYERGRYCIVDVGGVETTQFSQAQDDPLEVLPNEVRRELQPGNRIILGDVIALRVLEPEETNET